MCMARLTQLPTVVAPLMLTLFYVASFAQGPYIPPDCYPGASKPSVAMWDNAAYWLRYTDGTPVGDAQFVSDGTLPQVVMKKDAIASFVLHSVDSDTATVDTLSRIDLTIVGEMAQTPDAVALELKDQTRNYYFPHCAAENVQGYERVIYQEIYPNIDWHFYNANTAGLTMLFVVKPGGDPSNMILKFEGQDDIVVDASGLLRLYLNGKEIILNEAVAYQVDANNNTIPLAWSASYDDSQGYGLVHFGFGGYDPALPLVLRIGAPPFGGPYEENGLCWSTYMGGPGEEYIVDSDQDALDNWFVTGTTTSNIADFPPTFGNTFYSAGTVSFTVGLNAADQLDWKTFIGGSGNQICHTAGVAVRDASPTISAGVMIAGTTNAALPVWQPGNAHYEPTPGLNESGFVGRLDVGNGNRTWLTYFVPDASGSWLQIQGIDVAPNGRLFISGIEAGLLPPIDEPTTPAPNSTYYPPGFSMGGYWQGGFIAMFTPNDRLWWRTHIPRDVPNEVVDGCLVVANSDRVVLVGETGFPSHPMTPLAGAYNMPFQGLPTSGEYMIYEFDPNGVVNWATYYGGPDSELMEYDVSVGWLGWLNTPRTLALDPITSDLVFTGEATTSLPIVQGPNWYQSTPTIGWNGSFIARFDGTTRDLIWSTYLNGGAGSTTSVFAVAFDAQGNLYVAGTVSGGGLPLQSLPGHWYSPSIVPNTSNGSPGLGDAFIMSWDPQQNLRYATYFGGESGLYSETIYTMLERNGLLFFAGETTKDFIGGIGQYTTYFPLDEGDGVTPYFEDQYMGGAREAFMANVCMEMPTGLTPALPPGSGPVLYHDGQGHWLVGGLEVGTHQVVIVDLAGRVVADRVVRITDQHMVPLELPHCASGIYVLRTAKGSTRFQVP